MTEQTIAIGETGTTFNDLEAGDYNVSVLAEGYETHTETVSVVAGQTLTVTVTLVAETATIIVNVGPSTVVRVVTLTAV